MKSSLDTAQDLREDKPVSFGLYKKIFQKVVKEAPKLRVSEFDYCMCKLIFMDGFLFA